MSRVYSIQFSNVAVTAAQDFFEVLPATQKPVLIHAVYLSQSTELGDAAEEGLRLNFGRGHTTSGSGGSSVTPRPMDANDTAAGATCEVNNTTIASAGTNVILHSEVWNVRVPYVYMPAPEDRIRVANANIFVVRLMAAPNDSVTCNGTLVFEEI